MERQAPPVLKVRLVYKAQLVLRDQQVRKVWQEMMELTE
jgi:hypothetical protein